MVLVFTGFSVDSSARKVRFGSDQGEEILSEREERNHKFDVMIEELRSIRVAAEANNLRLKELTEKVDYNQKMMVGALKRLREALENMNSSGKKERTSKKSE